MTIDDNDSFEDEIVVGVSEMIAHGKTIGASHLLICSEMGSDPSATYVMPDEDVESVVDQCLGGCPSVEVVPL